MTRTIFSKVMWVGRATVFLVGLAVILALLLGAASMAFAKNGDPWLLGRSNVATAITTLGGKLGVNGPMVRIINNNADANDTALDLRVQSGEAPMRVNSTKKVANLNADKLDNREASSFANGVNGKATNADKLDGIDSTGFYRSGSKVANSDKLDGKEPGELPGVVVSTEGFAGPVSSIAGNTETFVFAGPTAQVTTTSAQRLVGAAQAPLALSTGDPKPFPYGLCYQPSGGGSLKNFVGSSVSWGEATTTRVSWSATATVVPGAGTWNVGFCVENPYSGAALDDNGSVNGWVQVVNP